MLWKRSAIYDFAGPDALADFAYEDGMNVRGHTLVWHQAKPQWLREGCYAPLAVRKMLKAYNRAFVGRFRGCIRQWDVVIMWPFRTRKSARG